LTRDNGGRAARGRVKTPAGDVVKLKGIENGYRLREKPKTWDDIPEAEPEADEIAAFAEYRAGR
jgi:hypothetical protein